MNSPIIPHSNYLDVLFEGRNKAYGSYMLRNSYDSRMKQAGAALLLLCAFLSVFALFKRSEQGVKSKVVHPQKIEKDVVHFARVEVVVPPTNGAQANKHLEKALPKPTKTVVYTVPQLVQDVQHKPDESLAIVKELDNAQAGTEQHEGLVGGTATTVQVGSGSGGLSDKLGSASTSHNEVHNFAEIDPEFPGGPEAMYQYLSEQLNYPASALNAGKEGKVLVRFVVNEDGLVTQVSVVRGFGYGSEEEAKRVIQSMPRWRAGRNNNKAVKVWFQVPIFFKLD